MTRPSLGGPDARTHPFPIFPASAPNARSWLAFCAAVPLLIALAAGTATAAAPVGDPAVITDWNAIAVTTLSADTTKQPVEDILYTAFVQAAVYNAVVGIEGRYAPYRFHAHAPRGASAQTAGVAAAHEILVTYVPSAQATLDADYAASLAKLPDGIQGPGQPARRLDA